MIEDIIKQIDDIAVSHPERVVYDYLGQTNTYGELKKRSDAWADKIACLDIPEHSPIMIWGGQNFEMIASFLGCVKQGHAYIPIASYSNAQRLMTIQEVSKAQVVLAIEPLPDIDLKNLQVIEPKMVQEVAEHAPYNLVSGDENFYIIFTSGTSGRPKGVQISHQNLLSFVNWELSDFALPEKPSFLVQAPYSFDLSVMSLYPALVAGGKLVVLPHEVTENFAQLFKILPNLHFNVWVSTPSFMQMCFLDKNLNETNHPELSHILFCGEELPHDEVSRLKQRFSKAKIFNTYGPTESTVAVTQVEITSEILEKYDRLPIGQVKEDTEITIDQEKGQNKQGEIVIAGPSVSKGYLNNPAKTDAAFFIQNDTRAHRSGDEGYFLDGLLFYVGRIDFQVKFNGYRIELEEINHYLGQDELIHHAVVAPKYGKEHTVKQLIAEIELAEGVKDKYTEDDLTKMIRENLAKKVMPYMVPQRVIYRDKLPISQNGKVDIKAVIKEVNE